jgi:hypothetical protein
MNKLYGFSIQQDLPPIRHLAPVEKKRRKKKRPDDKNIVAKSAEKIKAYDYRKWDKFNVVCIILV